MTTAHSTEAASARRLMRHCFTATLATSGQQDGTPYGSLAPVAFFGDGTPIVLMSDLAYHTQNAQKSPAASLFFYQDIKAEDPLTAPRVTVMGQLNRLDGEAADHAASLYRRRHPTAFYADFADFHYYALTVDKVHLVAGFGAVKWFKAADFLLAEAAHTDLSPAVPGILDHMNQDHSDANRLYATKLLFQPDGDWQMVGCDPEGFDLRAGALTARWDFDHLHHSPQDIRETLVALTAQARK